MTNEEKEAIARTVARLWGLHECHCSTISLHWEDNTKMYTVNDIIALLQMQYTNKNKKESE